MREDGHAERCDGCKRMRYDVERVGLLVEGQMRAERELCSPCRVAAIDGFLVAHDVIVGRPVRVS